jgi:Tfp pilus assembly protein PilE
MKLVNKLHQRGVTLFEVLLVLFVGAFIAVGVTVIYTRAVNSVSSSALNSDIQQLAASIHSLYTSTGNYGTSDMTAIAVTVAPADLINGTTPVTPSFVVGVGSQVGSWKVAGGNTTFTITVTDIPSSACASLAGFALQAGATTVNGAADPGGAVSGGCTSTTNSSAAMVFN